MACVGAITENVIIMYFTNEFHIMLGKSSFKITLRFLVFY